MQLKNFFSVIILGIFLLGITGTAIAQDNKTADSTELGNIITKLKGMFDIQDQLDEFNVSTETQGKLTYYNLSWHSKKQDNYKGLSIRYGSDGNVYSYYNDNKFSRYEERKKLYDLKRSEAKEKADQFLKLSLPTEYINFKVDTEAQNYQNEGYSFSYKYYRDNILVNGISAQIFINAYNGSVINYFCGGSLNNTFPNTQGILDIEKANASFATELGYKLIYRSKINYKDEKSTLFGVYPVYAPIYGSEYALDAKTGKRVLLFENRYYGDGDFKAGAMMNSKMAKKEVSLSPAEENAVKEVEGMLKKEAVENIVRKKGIPNLNDSFILNSSYLTTSYIPSSNGYTWYLGFVKKGEKPQEYENINVSLDAKTGEILSFNHDDRMYDSRSGDVSEDVAKKALTSFLQGFVPDKLQSTQLREQDLTFAPFKGENKRFINITYERTFNKIPFPENYITATYDCLAKTVSGFNITWYDASFTAADKALPLEQIYKGLFSANPLELRYYVINKDKEQNNNDVILTYNNKNNIMPVFDATTGKPFEEYPINYRDKPIGSYTDIENHYAKEQITALAGIGIGFTESSFKPDEVITQRDFLWFISKCYSSIAYIKAASDTWSEQITDNLYREMLQKGIIKEGEKAPEAQITREQAVKFIVRAMGYDSLAAHSDIFIIDFSDKADITPELQGYVAIAKGMGIVKGNLEGEFLPKQKVTRAQSAIMIYNFLKN